MNYTMYLRWGVISGLFATLFIPFIIADGAMMSSLFFPYITGKNFVFRIIIEIVAALYIILAIRDPKYRPCASWILWSVLAFVAWMAVATIAAADPLKSFWSNFERMEGYVGLMHLFVYFVIMGAVLKAEDLWDRFFNTSIGVSMVIGLHALLQGLQLFGLHPSSQSGARADGTFGNATYLAVYMLFSIFITLYMLARQGRLTQTMQSVYGLALVLQFAGLYLTQTRGALLGVIGGFLIAMIWVAWRAKQAEWKGLRMWAVGGMVALAALVGVFFALRQADLLPKGGTLARIASISTSDTTTVARFKYIWPTAFKGAAERPLLGWGQENFSYVFNKHYQPGMWNQEQWFDRAHNQFLDWMIAGGFPAFLLYISFFVLAAWAIIRSRDLNVPQQAALLGLLAAYAFNNLFVFDNLTSSLYFFTILAFVYGLSRQELPGKPLLSKPVSTHGVAIAAPIVLILVATAGWALNAPGLARAGTLVKTISNTSDPAATLENFKKSLNTGTWPGGALGYQETVEQFVNYAGNSIASSQASSDIKQDYFEASTAAMQSLMAQRRDDARLELFASGLHAQFGQLKEALAHAKRALELSPGKQQILFQVGLTHLNYGSAPEALAAFKQAYDSAPENTQALVYYAMGEYYAGNTAAGDALLVERFGTTLVDNDQVLQVYGNLKMYDRTVAIWKMRVEKNPKDFNTNLGLASAYYAAGDKAATVAQLKAMQQMDITRAEQLQKLIDQLSNTNIQIGQ
ncbi:MAG: O-antigen ligase family protein [Candidatus Pacebacteria bacterium]|nr:O-antigen ligase family protein [Candidatus Paceibacterota bacterium]